VSKACSRVDGNGFSRCTRTRLVQSSGGLPLPRHSSPCCDVSKLSAAALQPAQVSEQDLIVSHPTYCFMGLANGICQRSLGAKRH